MNAEIDCSICGEPIFLAAGDGVMVYVDEKGEPNPVHDTCMKLSNAAPGALKNTIAGAKLVKSWNAFD